MSDVFEQDLRAWLAHGDDLAARATVPDRVVRNVEALTLERPGRGVGRGRLLLVAAAVAAVLAGAIGLPHALLRSHSNGSAPAGPPGGVPDVRPPAGVDLVWVADPASHERMIALDRSGRPVGWLPGQADAMTHLVDQSADGQRLLLTDWQHGGTMELTAQGDRIALPRNSEPAGPGTVMPWPIVFSDDERSVCMETGQQGTPRNLVIIDPVGHVARTLPESPAGNPSYLSWHVVTCSVNNDVAVLIGQADPQPVMTPRPASTPTPQSQDSTHIGEVTGPSVTIHSVPVPEGQPSYVVRVVRLSTGAELARRIYGPGKPQPIDASEDGTMVLEVLDVNSYVLRDIRSGAIRGSLDATARGLLGNHLAIVQGDMSPQGDMVPRSVVDMLTGRVLWSATLPLPTVINYLGDSAVVTVAPQDAHPGDCATSARVVITDLTDGGTHSSTLDTCSDG